MSTSQNDPSKTSPGSPTNEAASAVSAAPSDGAVTESESVTVASRFIKMSNGERTLAEAVATVSRNGTKLYLRDRCGEYLITLEFEFEEDTLAEMDDVNAQLDRFEATRGSRLLGRPNRSTKRGMRRR